MKDDVFTHCLNCGAVIPLDHAHVVIHLYLRQPWVSWAEVVCDACGKQAKCFFGPAKWGRQLKWYHKREFGFITEDFPEHKIVKQFRVVYNLKKLKPKELTPAEENEVAFFAYLLARGIQE